MTSYHVGSWTFVEWTAMAYGVWWRPRLYGAGSHGGENGPEAAT